MIHKRVYWIMGHQPLLAIVSHLLVEGKIDGLLVFLINVFKVDFVSI